jgi:hypothetical protein
MINPLSTQIKQLFEEQLPIWEQCRLAYQSLSQNRIKKIIINGIEFTVQWNPGRITSTTAKVDAQSIQNRACFLCDANRPQEQNCIPIRGYKILVNPFPIFPVHFTIMNQNHVPQRIIGDFEHFLFFTREFGENFVVLYNGPKCGASAPDHAHFQAGTKNHLPIVKQLPSLKAASPAHKVASAEVRFVDDSLRKFILIEGQNEHDVHTAFNKVYAALIKDNSGQDEPLMNILSFRENNAYHVILYVREKHRPSCYFAADDAMFIFSPATIDISGAAVLPREEDFNGATPALIGMALKEVFVSAEKLAAIEEQFAL